MNTHRLMSIVMPLKPLTLRQVCLVADMPLLNPGCRNGLVSGSTQQKITCEHGCLAGGVM
jgi:hypothetical protein